MKARWRIAATLVVLVLGLAAAGFYYWRTHNITLVQRGYDEAMEHGCFTCHGLGGRSGVTNPGSRWASVPAWSGGTYMMFIKEEKEIREYILDGAPERLRKDKDWRANQAKALIHMPAFRRQLDEEDLEAIVAYFKAAAMYDSIDDETADHGRDAAASLGCFNCHGPEGRGCMPNPGALKGYIPSWDGADFPDLARNEDEIREWIQDGVARRLANNRLAVFFLRREKVQMPAYRGRISDDQLQNLVAYIRWLRKESEGNGKSAVK